MTELTHNKDSLIRLRWAIAAATAAVIPHLLHVPIWVSLVAFSLLGWRLAATFFHWPLPPSWLRIGLAAAVVGGVFLSFRTINGLDAGSALVIGMLGMKLLETKNARDLLVIVLIAYFLLIINFLYTQDIPALLYSLPAVWLMTMALLQVAGSRRALSARKAARFSGIALLQAAPLMCLLFLLFPRVPGPLWGLPAQTDSVTGLDDEMSPGTITRLSLSDEVAFTVRFEDTPPPAEMLYWRGPVLHRFDGRTWRRSWRNYAGEGGYDYEGEPWRYEVTLEPHNRHWLFSLDVPDAPDRGQRITYDFQLMSRSPVTSLRRYTVTSYPDHRLDPSPGERLLRYESHLPDGRNPQAVEFAKTLRAQAGSDAGVIRLALQYFNQQNFVYTLEPLALQGAHPVDRFLFDTREGFCEHYASAFATIMRAAGIPARVVTGYLGGERNPITGHVTVRQSDAHAWTEVWQSEIGWQRIDPTAAVAPWRVRSGLASSMPAGEPVAGRFMRQNAWLNQLRFGFDALNGIWNEFILGYGPEAQQTLMDKLGLKDADWRMLTVVLAVCLALAGTILALLILRQRPHRARDPAQRLYARFCQRVARATGISRSPAEGPVRFARRCADARPDLAAGIAGITELYLGARYAPTGNQRALILLKSRLRQFRP
ncbi:MAG: DUF3488 domain-containing transglutaminase family protein [Gammaproteobacteria bacterium]|nr:DUF3488 domain-containing transglutaminase family protein [Gammaproteobacteria bacterium]